MNTYEVNPAGFAYIKAEGALMYGGPCGRIVTGQENRELPVFGAVQAAGGGAYAYIYPTGVPEICGPGRKLNRELYRCDENGVPSAPLWEPKRLAYVDSFGTNWFLSAMHDPVWRRWLVSYIRDEILRKKFRGVFLDSMAPMRWNKLLQWPNWPAEERILWAESCVKFLQELDYMRREEDDTFEIMGNGLWEPHPTLPVNDELLDDGRRCMDGICIEHHPWDRATAVSAAAREYSNLGHRRVLWIVLPGEVDKVRQNQGVTLISDAVGYTIPVAPAVPFVDNRLPERDAQIERLKAKVEDLEGENNDLKSNMKDIEDFAKEITNITGDWE